MRTGSGHIVLHVGAPKTGSTYLQRRLRSEPSVLRAQGVYVPVMPSVENMAGNAKLLASVLTGHPSLTFKRVFPQIDLHLLDPRNIVNELFLDWHPAHETIVLSAENFRPSHASRLRELLPSEHDVRVVLFIRRQDLWIESYYNQLIKTADIRCNLGDFAKSLFDRQSDRFCFPDWEEHHNIWHSVFGNCNLVFFEEVRDRLFNAFCAAAGLTPAVRLQEVGPQQLSLSSFQLAYLSTLLPSITYDEFSKRRRAIESVACETDAPSPPPARFIDADLYAEIVTRFSPSNIRLLQNLGLENNFDRLAFPSRLVGNIPIEEILMSEEYQEYCRRVNERFDNPAKM